MNGGTCTSSMCTPLFIVETSVTSVTNETARAVSTGILYSLDTAVLDRVIRGLIKDYGSSAIQCSTGTGNTNNSSLL